MPDHYYTENPTSAHDEWQVAVEALGNRMTFDSVSAEIPSDRIAPPTYYNKVGVLKFISVMSASLPK